ncbi:PEPxxWA-CTERM sorting domain-containing protein [Phenylobacterium sp.]|uniref:PEPxxWA-CTERM sorting domain-containing protein n=1 Tax=Phenylobacterium sp. TaxID=1871053 RepID=UPI0025F98AE9|nr:PEPxxWA-CTERM sorting domain-containing protein [Phenylobacterium sp.]MBX3483158.1 PEPxxWA-CTERM sorting domain-containing protein [Phenylobacterium sp.]MCW5759553.1 PEPxxWA-CTERM sorting domain-containing protein [Phenylobacterium sp.]
MSGVIVAAMIVSTMTLSATAAHAITVVDTGAAAPTPETVDYTVGNPGPFSQSLFGMFTANVDTITSIEGFFRNNYTQRPVTATVYGDDAGQVDLGDVLGSATFDVASLFTGWAGAFGLSISVDKGANYWVEFSANSLPVGMPDTAVSPLADYAFANTAGIVLHQADMNIGMRITGNAVPEPATWALMIGGFGLAGAALRRRRNAARTIA